MTSDKVWVDKDRRISRLACIKAAVEMVLGSGEWPNDPDAAISVAKKFEAYCYEGMDEEQKEPEKDEVVIDKLPF